MKSSRRRLAAVAVALLVTSSACSPHKVRHDPLPPVAIPDRWTASAPEAAALPDRWWQSFGDEQLDRLIVDALGGNLQLRAAWARVRQARAIVIQARSAKLPSLDFTAQASVARQRFEISDTMVFTPTVESYSVSAAAAYEVDLWKRIGSSHAAAALDALAMRDDAEAIATSIAAEITEAWFDIVAAKAQQQQLREQQKINETYLELTLLRLRQGVATAIDVFQQRQQVLSTRALIEQTEAALRVSRARLAVLLGRAPSEITWVDSAPAALPEPTATPATGVPADLLVRRPDVRAARRRAEAADHRVVVAIADRLPALRIGGSAGFTGGKIYQLFDGLDRLVFNAFGQIAQSIFDYGRREAEVERNRDVVDERLLQLGQVLIGAIAEVDQALAEETNRRIEIATIQERRKLAAETLTEAREFYSQGLIDYLSVLTALAAAQSLEIQELQARRGLLSARVRLCRSLGGTWTNALAVPARAQRKG